MSRQETLKAYWASEEAHSRRAIIVTRECKQCGKSYSGRPAMIGRDFCSRSCRGEARRKIVIKECRSCGLPFSGPQSLMVTRAHCSNECRKRRTVYTCEQCGVEREVRPSETAKRFCGDECRLKWFSSHFIGEESPQWRGGCIESYGPSWEPAREAVRERDGYHCQDCRIHEDELPEHLSVAHIIPFREFGIERHEEANAIDNLRSLCRKCHIKFDHSNGTRGKRIEVLGTRVEPRGDDG